MWAGFASPLYEVLAPLPDRLPGYLAYLALIYFTLLIVTYYLPGGQAAAGIAVILALGGLVLGNVPLARGMEPLLLIGLVLVALLSVPGALDPVWAKVRAWELLKIALIYLTAIHVLLSGHRIMRFAALWFGAYMLFPIRGTLVSYVGGYNVFGRALWNYAYENSNDLAALSLLSAAVGGALFFVFSRRVARVGLAVALCTIAAVIMLTGSRGGFLGVVAGLAIFFGPRLRRAKVIAGLTVGVLVAIAFSPTVFRERMATLVQLDQPNEMRHVDAGSVATRLDIWRTAFLVIRDNPILGVGIGSYPMANELYSKEAESVEEVLPRLDAHSSFLTLWAEIGTLGLLVYCGFLAATWYRARSVRRRWRHHFPDLCSALGVLEVGVVGFAVASLWATYTKLTLPYLFFALTFSWATEIERLGRRDWRPTRRARRAKVAQSSIPAQPANR